MERLRDIAPKGRGRVIDLVHRAGLDVSDWSNSSRGREGASTNPKYCYEWAFQDERTVVLNLWHEELEEFDGLIQRRGNFRADSERYRLEKRPTSHARAHRIDVAIQDAATYGLGVRVILNAGRPRSDGDTASTRSVVDRRELDPQPWYISEYDKLTGAHVLTRGTGFIDQFTLIGDARQTAEWRDQFGRVFVRSASVRSAALLRAAGRCEYCRAEGFRTASGSIYLETHHVDPLSEGGADSSSNVIALCANHHREAHHGGNRVVLRAQFETILARMK